MNKYNVLIIGAGKQGSEADHPKSEKIISFAHAFKKHDGFNNIMFADIDNEKAINAAVKWNCMFTENYKHSLYDFDIAVVSTNDNMHYKILKNIADYPLKLIICEKPICETVEQAREIVDLYKQKNIPFMVNYTRRFLPYYESIKNIGKPIFGICTFNRGWLHTATHGIDFFNMLEIKDYKILENKVNWRMWQLNILFDNGYIWEEKRFGEEPVWNYYNKTHWYVVENAYNFLEGKEEIKCTGEDALKALEKCYELMGAI